MSVMQQFSARLKYLREKNNLSQQDLANALNISRGSVSFYEKSERTADIEILVSAAKYFNVSVEYLLGLTETPSCDTDIKMICDYTGLNEEAIIDLRRSEELKNPDNEYFKVYVSKSDVLNKIISFEHDEYSKLFNILHEISWKADLLSKQINEYASKADDYIEKTDFQNICQLNVEKQKTIRESCHSYFNEVNSFSSKINDLDFLSYKANQTFNEYIKLLFNHSIEDFENVKEKYRLIFADRIVELSKLIHDNEGTENGNDNETE